MIGNDSARYRVRPPNRPGPGAVPWFRSIPTDKAGLKGTKWQSHEPGELPARRHRHWLLRFQEPLRLKRCLLPSAVQAPMLPCRRCQYHRWKPGSPVSPDELVPRLAQHAFVPGSEEKFQSACSGSKARPSVDRDRTRQSPGSQSGLFSRAPARDP